jgi:hypothetical protein
MQIRIILVKIYIRIIVLDRQLRRESTSVDLQLESTGLAKLLQKLRFEIEIENMEKSYETQNCIAFESLIEHFFITLSKQNICDQMHWVIKETLSHEYSNIPEKLTESVLRNTNWRSPQITQNKKDSSGNPDAESLRGRDLALKYIRQR